MFKFSLSSIKSIYLLAFDLRFFLGLPLCLVLNALVLNSPQLLYGQNTSKIAVLQLSNRAKIKESEIIYLTSQIQELVQQKTKGQYQVMTQENILTLLPPDQSLENCIEAQCEVDVGRLLGASLVVTGHIFRFGSQQGFRCTLKIHETQTGTLISSQTMKAQKIDQIENQLIPIIDQLLKDGLNFRLESNEQVKKQVSPQAKQPMVRPIDWVLIEGGEFMMSNEFGLPHEQPSHLVKVNDFYMTKTEITNAQYEKCVKAGICTPPHWEDELCYVYQTSKRHWQQGIVPLEFRGENQPVICIEWQQARIFAKWIGGDLPSEAQWEYASRSGGKDIKYPWGNAEATCEYAVMSDEGDGCGRDSTWEVCSKTGGNTAQGLCDMGGNVWEWVLDEWHGSYSGAPSDDIGWCSDSGCDSNTSAHRVFRGGSWCNSASYLRSADRLNDSSGVRNHTLGFRVSDLVH
jgi:formylglycine-generating enzyme required for sulfatase activity